MEIGHVSALLPEIVPSVGESREARLMKVLERIQGLLLKAHAEDPLSARRLIDAQIITDVMMHAAFPDDELQPATWNTVGDLVCVVRWKIDEHWMGELRGVTAAFDDAHTPQIVPGVSMWSAAAKNRDDG